jgi:glutamyl/glutaminyl-tRNA synthetase
MNTRFNPTTNGRLHLGHLYLILLNRQAAEDNGGKFICRFDDVQDYWIERLGREQLYRNSEHIMEDLEWMKIRVTYSWQSQESEKNEKLIQSLGELSRQIPSAGEDERHIAHIVNQERPYPYVPYLTAIKVAQDYWEEINPLIRGEDLATEFSLYCYFCEALGFPTPKMYFVPKLLQASGEDLTDMSKTAGDHKIADYRKAGYQPSDLIEILSRSCLEVPQLGWSIRNVKKHPILTIS